MFGNVLGGLVLGWLKSEVVSHVDYSRKTFDCGVEEWSAIVGDEECCYIKTYLVGGYVWFVENSYVGGSLLKSSLLDGRIY